MARRFIIRAGSGGNSGNSGRCRLLAGWVFSLYSRVVRAGGFSSLLPLSFIPFPTTFLIPSQNTATPSNPSWSCSLCISCSFFGAKFGLSRSAKPQLSRVDFRSAANLPWLNRNPRQLELCRGCPPTRRTFSDSLKRWFGMNARRIFSLAVVIVAIGVAIALHSSADSGVKPGDVNESRIDAEAVTGTNWLVNGRTNDSKHFSPLKQINDQNIGNLSLAWYLDYDGKMGIVSEPIVVDGVIYVSAPLSKIYAVEASTGKLLWKYDPQIRLDQALNGSYSARTNGGVAVWSGKVYVGTGDCRLIAIDAATTKKLWEATVCEPLQTGITGAPRVARGKILMGYK